MSNPTAEGFRAAAMASKDTDDFYVERTARVNIIEDEDGIATGAWVRCFIYIRADAAQTGENEDGDGTARRGKARRRKTPKVRGERAAVDVPLSGGSAGCVESGERVVRAVNERDCVPAAG